MGNIYDTLDDAPAAKNPYDALDKVNPYDALDSVPEKLSYTVPTGKISGTFPQPAKPDEGGDNTELLRAIMADKGRQIPAAIGEAAMLPFSVAGKVLNAGAQDIGATVSGHPEYGGNIYDLFDHTSPDEAAKPLPYQETLRGISKSNPIAATAGKIAAGTVESVPMMAAGMPAGALGKVITGKFLYDMAQSGGQAGGTLYAELQKPKADRDMDVITTSVSDLAQTGLLAPLMAVHASHTAKGNAIREISANLKDADIAPPSEMDSIRNLSPVEFPPGTPKLDEEKVNEGLKQTAESKILSQIAKPSVVQKDNGAGRETPATEAGGVEMPGSRPATGEAEHPMVQKVNNLVEATTQLRDELQAALRGNQLPKPTPAETSPVVTEPSRQDAGATVSPAPAASLSQPSVEAQKNAPATITGFNEGKVSEMPAEAGVIPAPEQSSEQILESGLLKLKTGEAMTPEEQSAVAANKKTSLDMAAQMQAELDAKSRGAQTMLPSEAKPANSAKPTARKGFWIRPRSDGIHDILDEIQQQGGIRSPEATDNGGEYDGFKESMKGQAGLLRRRGSGLRPDVLVERVKEAFPRIQTPDDLYEAVKSAVAQREKLKTTGGGPEAQTQKFWDTVGQPANAKGLEKISVDQLSVGQKFRVKAAGIAHDELEVVSVNPDDNTVTVKDGPTFGTQDLPEGAEIYIRKGTLVDRPVKTMSSQLQKRLNPGDVRFAGGDFSFDQPESVADQKARQAEEKRKADEAKAKAAMLDKSQRRLTGADVDTNQEMFGAEVKQDKSGQQSMFAVGEKPVWRSNIEDALASWQNKGTAEQLRAHLAKTRGAMDEAEWIGLDDFLNGKPSVTKAEVADFVARNKVDVQEVTKGRQELPDRPKPVTAYDFWKQEQEPFAGHGNISEEFYNSLPHNYRVTYENMAAGRTRPISQIARDDTKFSNYQLPGGENYRELLLTLPEKTADMPEVQARIERNNKRYVELTKIIIDPSRAEWEKAEARMEQQQLADDSARRVKRLKDGQGNFQSFHFDEPNILAHVRFNERTDADGKKVLHIEEVQSDWHQKGRKGGYRASAEEFKRETYSASDVNKALQQDSHQWFFIDRGGKRQAVGKGVVGNAEDAAEYLASVANRDEQEKLEAYRQKTSESVPDAPFKQTWPMLAMKRMIRYAADNGFDRITWTTGEQQAARYDLSKQVDSIKSEAVAEAEGVHLVDVDVKGEGKIYLEIENGKVREATRVGGNVVDTLKDKPLDEVIGKEMADRILSQEPGTTKTYSGLDLKVGGEGMKGFYDKILPSEVNKFVKKWGGKVGQAEIPSGERRVFNHDAITPVSKNDVAAKIKSIRAVWELPGRTAEGWQNWNTALDAQADSVLNEMNLGASYGKAMEQKGSKQLAEKLGFGGEFGGAPETSHVHSLDITPAMKEAAQQGLPMFAKGNGRGLIVEAATDAINSHLGTKELPSGIKVIRDETAPWGARIEGRNKITVNAAQIRTPERAKAVIMEEGFHGVWHDPAVQKAWQSVRDLVTPDEMRAERLRREAQGLPTDTATIREEAAIARLLDGDANKGVFARLYDVIRNSIKRIFGIDLPATGRQALKDAAMEFLRNRDDWQGAKGDAQEAFAAGDKEDESKPFTRPNGLGIQKFYTDDVLKTIKGIPNGVAQLAGLAREGFHNLFAPESASPRARATDALAAKYVQTREQIKQAFQKQTENQSRFWDTLPEKDRLDFLQAMETGETPKLGTNTAQAVALAKQYRERFDADFHHESTLGIQANYRDNYFPHLWKDPTAATKFFAELKDRMGRNRYAKAREINLISEGLKAGLDLIDTNPERLALRRDFDSARLTTQQTFVNELVKQGLAEKTERRGLYPNRTILQAPDGFSYALPKDVAAVVNNAFFQKSLWEDQTLIGKGFRGLMAAKNLFIPVKLGLSLFHPVHIVGIDNAARLANIIESLKDKDLSFQDAAILAVKSQGNFVRPRGKQFLDAYNRYGFDDTLPEDMKQSVQMMIDGGFNPNREGAWKTASADGFKRAVTQGNYPGAVIRGVPALLHSLQKPIFDLWIPRLRAAGFDVRARELMRTRPELANDPVQRAVELRKIGKEIDNQYGEMNYSTLFWNRYMRDVGVGSSLSMGWNLGFVREFGGAAIDYAKSAKQLATMKRPEITNKMIFTAAYTAQAMLFGGLMTWALTGKPPTQFLDYFYPKTGHKNEDGSDERLSTPYYTREYFMAVSHLQKDGLVGGMASMLAGKGNPLFSPLINLYQNKDFFGYEIHDPHSPYIQQAEQIAGFLGKEAMPISVASGIASHASTTAKIASYAGFNPAPRYITRTAIQNDISNLYERRFGGGEQKPYTKRLEFETKQAIKQAQASGDTAKVAELEAEAERNNVLTARQVAYQNRDKVPGDVFMFRRLPVGDKEALRSKMTPEELQKYQ